METLITFLLQILRSMGNFGIIQHLSTNNCLIFPNFFLPKLKNMSLMVIIRISKASDETTMNLSTLSHLLLFPQWGFPHPTIPSNFPFLYFILHCFKLDTGVFSPGFLKQFKQPWAYIGRKSTREFSAVTSTLSGALKNQRFLALVSSFSLGTIIYNATNNKVSGKYQSCFH